MYPCQWPSTAVGTAVPYKSRPGRVPPTACYYHTTPAMLGLDCNSPLIPMTLQRLYYPRLRRPGRSPGPGRAPGPGPGGRGGKPGSPTRSHHDDDVASAANHGATRAGSLRLSHGESLSPGRLSLRDLIDPKIPAFSS